MTESNDIAKTADDDYIKINQLNNYKNQFLNPTNQRKLNDEDQSISIDI